MNRFKFAAVSTKLRAAEERIKILEADLLKRENKILLKVAENQDLARKLAEANATIQVLKRKNLRMQGFLDGDK